jgi:hypothetical protein
VRFVRYDPAKKVYFQGIDEFQDLVKGISSSFHLTQHGLDHFHGLDLELEMLDHAFFHHDL